MGLVAVGGGVAAAFVLTRGSDGTVVGGGELPSAVTSEPEESWRTSFGAMVQLTVIGSTVVVSNDEDQELAAFDDDGEELWSVDTDSYSYAREIPGDDEHVLVQESESTGIVVYSLADGEELWGDDDAGYVVGFGDGRMYLNEEAGSESYALTAVDSDSGDEQWSLRDVEASTTTGDAVYAVTDGDLVSLDSGSGDERWTTDLDLDPDDYASLAAVDDFVVASTGSGVTAFSADDGEELWSHEPADSEASVSVGAASPDRVFVDETSYADDVIDEQVTVFDVDGEVGELDNEPDESFYATAFESGGTDYLLNFGDGSLFDDTLERVAGYDGQVAMADQGIYTLEDGELGYHEYGTSTPRWRIDVDEADEEDGESEAVVAGDEMVVVIVGDTVTAYR